MSKAKTVEYLNGLKFMQRKEETKRRERFELWNMNEATRASTRKVHTDAPVILHVPSEELTSASYSLSRQSFLTTEVPDRIEGKDVEEEESKGKLLNPEEMENTVEGVFDEEEEEGEQGEEDPTAAPRQKRFVVPESVRAPELPKFLRTNGNKKRQRE